MASSVVIIIPARYQSSRFPGKPLVLLKGVPMIVRVAKICERVVGKENVYVATDSELIVKEVRRYGFRSLMTSEKSLTGTDRVAEAALKVHADTYVNVQGDEPLISPEDIQKVIDLKIRNPDCVINAMTEFDPNDDSINIPKAVTSESGDLLYISRSLIPGSKSLMLPELKYYKQVCCYALSLDELRKFKNFGRKSRLESIEDIEILRFFELGIKVKMAKVSNSSIAVDVPEDVNAVNARLNE